MEIVDKHAPLVERRVTHIKQPGLFIDDIKEAKYLRDKYSDTNDVDSYL